MGAFILSSRSGGKCPQHLPSPLQLPLYCDLSGPPFLALGAYRQCLEVTCGKLACDEASFKAMKGLPSPPFNDSVKAIAIGKQTAENSLLKFVSSRSRLFWSRLGVLPHPREQQLRLL